jgi:hypothetical protein
MLRRRSRPIVKGEVLEGQGWNGAFLAEVTRSSQAFDKRWLGIYRPEESSPWWRGWFRDKLRMWMSAVFLTIANGLVSLLFRQQYDVCVTLVLGHIL